MEQTVGHRVEVANKQLIKNIHRIYNRKPYYQDALYSQDH